MADRQESSRKKRNILFRISVLSFHITLEYAIQIV